MMSRQIVALAVAMAMATISCGSTSLPEPLVQVSGSCGSSASLPYSIRVISYEHPVYSEDLAEVLSRSGVFRKVLSPDEPGSADLIAEVDRQISGTAVIPVLTILSLGLVPTIVSEEYGHSFSISGASSDGTAIPIDTSFEAKTWLGWFGGIRALSPGSKMGNPERSSVYIANLRASICAHERELRELVGR